MKTKRSKPLISNKAVIEADMPRAPKIPRVPLKLGADLDHVAPHGWLSGGDRPAPGKAKAKAKRGR
jgi:hypothetical protein